MRGNLTSGKGMEGNGQRGQGMAEWTGERRRVEVGQGSGRGWAIKGNGGKAVAGGVGRGWRRSGRDAKVRGRSR